MNLMGPVVGWRNKITQKFGANPDGLPDYYRKNFGYLGHNGIDIYGLKGDPILAAAAGKVTYASHDATGFGNLVVILDDSGRKHYYAHLSSIAVTVGDVVTRGKKIGGIGNTGNVISGPYSDGTHLHYGILPANPDKKNGYGGFVDPMPFLTEDIADAAVQVPAAVTAETESRAGWAEIINQAGANVRPSPGGEPVKTWFPTGVRVYKVGRAAIANGLVWEEITGGLFIARSDSEGTVMLKDVEAE